MSTPQVIPTVVVFDYVTDAQGNALRGKQVKVWLNYAGAMAIAPPVFVDPVNVTTTTDNNGYWQASLVPQSNITPVGTAYIVEVAGLEQYQIVVPNSGPVQTSSILANQPSILSPALTNLVGPITITGTLSVTGNESVSGTLAVASGTTLSTLSAGVSSFSGDITIGARLLLVAAISKLVPGATSFSIRDTGDANDNLIVTNAGNATVRNLLQAANLTLLGAPATLSLTGTGTATIKGGTVGLNLANNAGTLTNLGVTDAGNVTVRGSLAYGSLSTALKARAYLTGVQASAGATITKVNLDTKTGVAGWDPNGNFDVATNHNYTAPLSGFYLACYRASNTPGTVVVGTSYLYVNGAERTNSGQASSGGSSGTPASDILQLTAGDVVDLRFGGSGTTNFATGIDSCFLAIHYLSS